MGCWCVACEHLVGACHFHRENNASSPQQFIGPAGWLHARDGGMPGGVAALCPRLRAQVFSECVAFASGQRIWRGWSRWPPPANCGSGACGSTGSEVGVRSCRVGLHAAARQGDALPGGASKRAPAHDPVRWHWATRAVIGTINPTHPRRVSTVDFVAHFVAVVSEIGCKRLRGSACQCVLSA